MQSSPKKVGVSCENCHLELFFQDPKMVFLSLTSETHFEKKGMGFEVAGRKGNPNRLHDPFLADPFFESTHEKHAEA